MQIELRNGIPWVRAPVVRDKSESWEQRAVIQEARGWTVTHVPNGGKRGKAEAARLKADGVRAGFPDLHCVREGVTVLLEMKCTSGGRLSADQKRTIPALIRRGAEVYVCEGWEAATWSLENGRPRPWHGSAGGTDGPQ